MSKATAAFLDTSIQIARLIHSPETRRRIDERLESFDLTTTGLVVRQEFKSRLLKDARYLLDLFLRHQSFAGVHRHVVDVLTPYQRRKQRISLQVLSTLIEDDSDADRTDRAILLLRGLLRDGLYEFDQSVGHVVQKSQNADVLGKTSGESENATISVRKSVTELANAELPRFWSPGALKFRMFSRD